MKVPDSIEIRIDATWTYARCQAARAKMLLYRAQLERDLGDIRAQLEAPICDPDWKRKGERERWGKVRQLEQIAVYQRELTRRMKLLNGSVEPQEFCYRLFEVVSARLGEDEADKIFDEAEFTTTKSIAEALACVDLTK